jgi:hypothetical protein
VSGSVTFSSYATKELNAHTLQLSGPTSSWIDGSITLTNGAALIVDPTSTLSITADYDTLSGSTGQVINYGTISSTYAGIYTGATISAPVVNYGTSTCTLFYSTCSACGSLFISFQSLCRRRRSPSTLWGRK